MPHAISSALSLRMGENFLRNSSPKAARKISSVLERFLAAVSRFFFLLETYIRECLRTEYFLTLFVEECAPPPTLLF